MMVRYQEWNLNQVKINQWNMFVVNIFPPFESCWTAKPRIFCSPSVLVALDETCREVYRDFQRLCRGEE